MLIRCDFILNWISYYRIVAKLNVSSCTVHHSPSIAPERYSTTLNYFKIYKFNTIHCKLARFYFQTGVFCARDSKLPTFDLYLKWLPLINEKWLYFELKQLYYNCKELVIKCYREEMNPWPPNSSTSFFFSPPTLLYCLCKDDRWNSLVELWEAVCQKCGTHLAGTTVFSALPSLLSHSIQHNWRGSMDRYRYYQSIPVLRAPFYLFHSACPVLSVLSACPVLPGLFCLSCSACPVLPFLFCLSCSACPVQPAPLCLSCSACPVLHVPFWMSVMPVLFCLSCPVLMDQYR
jgi:hypothetical protein